MFSFVGFSIGGTLAAHGPMGSWAHGPMGPLAHGPTGTWAHGHMGPMEPMGPWTHEGNFNWRGHIVTSPGDPHLLWCCQ